MLNKTYRYDELVLSFNKQCRIAEITEIANNFMEQDPAKRKTLMCGAKVAEKNFDFNGLTKSLAIELLIGGLFMLGGALGILTAVPGAAMLVAALSSAFVCWGSGHLTKDLGIDDETGIGISFAASALVHALSSKKFIVQAVDLVEFGVKAVAGYLSGTSTYQYTKGVDGPGEKLDAAISNIASDSLCLEYMSSTALNAISRDSMALLVSIGVYGGLVIQPHFSGYAKALDAYASCNEDLYFTELYESTL